MLRFPAVHCDLSLRLSAGELLAPASAAALAAGGGS